MWTRHLLDRALPISTQAAQIGFDNQLVRIEGHWSEQYFAMEPHTLGYINYGLARGTRAASWARKNALSARLKTKRQLEEEKLAKQSALIVKEDTAVSENEGAEDGSEGEEHENDDEAEEVREGEGEGEEVAV